MHGAAGELNFPFGGNLARANCAVAPACLCRARFYHPRPTPQWSVHGADVHTVQPVLIRTSSAGEEISHAGLSPPGKHVQGYLERHTYNVNLLFEALDELKGQLYNKPPRGRSLCVFSIWEYGRTEQRLRVKS